MTLRSFFVQHQYMIPVYFLRLRNLCSVLVHWSVRRFDKKMLLNAYIYLLGIFFVFHRKIWAFIISISSFDEVSNFWNRILTNQKHELASRPCWALSVLSPEPNVELFVAKPYFNFLTKKRKNTKAGTTKRERCEKNWSVVKKMKKKLL